MHNLINAPNNIIYNDSLNMVILRIHCVLSLAFLSVGWLLFIVTLVHLCYSAIVFCMNVKHWSSFIFGFLVLLESRFSSPLKFYHFNTCNWKNLQYYNYSLLYFFIVKLSYYTTYKMWSKYIVLKKIFINTCVSVEHLYVMLCVEWFTVVSCQYIFIKCMARSTFMMHNYLCFCYIKEMYIFID